MFSVDIFFHVTIDWNCSRSHDSDGDCNPGNNLYVTGLSTRVTTGELEKYFSGEGKVSVFSFSF